MSEYVSVQKSTSSGLLRWLMRLRVQFTYSDQKGLDDVRGFQESKGTGKARRKKLRSLIPESPQS